MGRRKLHAARHRSARRTRSRRPRWRPILPNWSRSSEALIETLGQFGIAVAAGDITKGPTITRYEVYPAKGVRVDKIVSLERDLARATRAERINILAPIPGKDTVGIELANSRKVKVTLRELLQSADWEEAKTRCENSARARQGCLRQNDHRRSRADAAPARRRHDRAAARASASTRSSRACSTDSRPRNCASS